MFMVPVPAHIFSGQCLQVKKTGLLYLNFWLCLSVRLGIATMVGLSEGNIPLSNRGPINVSQNLCRIRLNQKCCTVGDGIKERACLRGLGSCTWVLTLTKSGFHSWESDLAFLCQIKDLTVSFYNSPKIQCCSVFCLYSVCRVACVRLLEFTAVSTTCQLCDLGQAFPLL